jgi:hypothetical protein
MEWLKIFVGPIVSFIAFLIPFGDKKLQEKSIDYEKKTAFQEEDLIKLICVFLYKNHKNSKFEKLKSSFIAKYERSKKIECLKNSYLMHTEIVLGDKIDFYITKYIDILDSSLEDDISTLKDAYKNQDKDAIRFCELILKFKSNVESNNDNYLDKISLISLFDSFSDKTVRLEKLMTVINHVIDKNHNDDTFTTYSEIRIEIPLSNDTITGLNRYIGYLYQEIDKRLLNSEGFVNYFAFKENSREENKINKSKEFFPNYYNLILFYFITGLIECHNADFEKMRVSLLELINILRDKIKISNEGMMTNFRNLEWIKFKEKKETDKPYYSSSYWKLKENICENIFGIHFFSNLSKDNIGSFIKNYYIEHDKMKNNSAKSDLQNYFLKITKMLNKEQLILLSKEYNV